MNASRTASGFIFKFSSLGDDSSAADAIDQFRRNVRFLRETIPGEGFGSDFDCREEVLTEGNADPRFQGDSFVIPQLFRQIFDCSFQVSLVMASMVCRNCSIKP